MTRGQTPRSGRLPTYTGQRTVLPREGRQGPTPAWPLPGDPTDREAELWASVWRRPIAILWERDSLEDDVALYVRKKAEAEQPRSSSSLVDSVQKLADHLMLTYPAMVRAGVTIADEEAPARKAPARPSSRERFGTTAPAARPRDGSAVDAKGNRIPVRERFRTAPAGPAPEED